MAVPSPKRTPDSRTRSCNTSAINSISSSHNSPLVTSPTGKGYKVTESIKVAVRARPFSQRELALGCTCVVGMNGPSTVVHASPPRVFVFDACYWSHDSSSASFAPQEAIMQDIGNVIVDNALDGFNGCLFAYGQTGSGKTFSVLGTESSPGLVPWTLTRLFNEQATYEKDGGHELRVSASFLEIYNDHLRDLLHLKINGDHELRVIDHPTHGVYVAGVSEEPCDSYEKADKLLAYGTKARMVAATSMHDHSSRSHAVFTIKLSVLHGAKPPKGEKDTRREYTSKINFVDLAGSERQSKTHNEGTTFKEGCAINKGLTALGLVIRTLAENSATGKYTMVPFRTSKMTFLLKDSLQGNSKTQMLATISAASDNVEETIGTLRFASSVKEIKTNASRNILTHDNRQDIFDQMARELEELREKLRETLAERELEDHPDIFGRTWMLEQMRRDYDEKLEQAKAVDAARDQVMKDMQLSADAIHSSFGVDKMTPYLLNMSDDPTLAGCLLFYLLPGIQRTVGSAPESSIQIRGIGISNQLCVIENKNNTYVTITKCSRDGRVVVSGKPLDENKPYPIRHGMRVYLGRAFALKVCIPASAQVNMLDEHTDLVLEGLEDECSTIEHSATWNNMQDFVRHMIQQMPPEHASAFMEEVKLAVKVCDEANEITNECRRRDGLSFEADITGAMRPSVVVRVLKSWGQEADDSNQCQQLYIWSTSQMMERLDRMRECYHNFCYNGSLNIDGLQDPWHEAHITEIWHALTDVQIQLQDAIDQNTLLKSSRLDTVARAIGLWSEDKLSVSKRIVFSMWKQLCSDRKKERRSTATWQRTPSDKAAESQEPKMPSIVGMRQLGQFVPSAPAPQPQRKESKPSTSNTLPAEPVAVEPVAKQPMAKQTIDEPVSEANVAGVKASQYDTLLDRFESLLDRLSPRFAQQAQQQNRPISPNVRPAVNTFAPTPVPVNPAAPQRLYPMMATASRTSAPCLAPAPVCSIPTAIPPPGFVPPVVLTSAPPLSTATWPQGSAAWSQGLTTVREHSPDPRATSPTVQIRTTSPNPGTLPPFAAQSPRLQSLASSSTVLAVGAPRAVDLHRQASVPVTRAHVMRQAPPPTRGVSASQCQALPSARGGSPQGRTLSPGPSLVAAGPSNSVPMLPGLPLTSPRPATRNPGDSSLSALSRNLLTNAPPGVTSSAPLLGTAEQLHAATTWPPVRSTMPRADPRLVAEPRALAPSEPRQRPGLFDMIDQDHNGVIDRAELDRATMSWLREEVRNRGV